MIRSSHRRIHASHAGDSELREQRRRAWQRVLYDGRHRLAYQAIPGDALRTSWVVDRGYYLGTVFTNSPNSLTLDWWARTTKGQVSELPYPLARAAAAALRRFTNGVLVPGMEDSPAEIGDAGEGTGDTP